MWNAVRDWFGWREFGHAHGHGHGHGHGDDHGHGHVHGIVDPTIASTSRGIWAIKWSFALLAATAVLQMAVVAVSGSVALLADTIHNIGDAATAVPLWIAFVLVRRPPTRRFTYGLGRVEDLAGVAIVAIILFSALVAGYQAIDRLIHPQAIGFLGWVAAAGIIGFAGNEAVAVLRIRVGRRINSVALIADGYHARTDGLTSLAVVGGAAGVWLGFPLADPIVGLVITAMILGIVWQSGRAVFSRLLDGVEPGLAEDIRHAAAHVPDIRSIGAVRVRWLGHRLHAEVDVILDGVLSLAEVDRIVARVRAEVMQHLPVVAVVHVAASGLGEEAKAPV
jgi:cation diffusion facilitator family transporter